MTFPGIIEVDNVSQCAPMKTDYDYGQYKDIRYHFKNAKIHSMKHRQRMFWTRRMYRILSINGSLTEAFYMGLNGFYFIAAIVCTSLVSSTNQMINRDQPLTGDQRNVTFNNIFITLEILVYLFGIFGLLRYLVYIFKSRWYSTQEKVGYKLFRYRESLISSNERVFFTKIWRFDAKVDDPREAYQFMHSEKYDELTGRGFFGEMRQFFMVDKTSGIDKSKYYHTDGPKQF